MLCHVTDCNNWDIPKGQPNEKESYIDAAIRECYEETGFVVKSKDDLYPLGIVEYNRFKSLALYLYHGDEFPNENMCKCTSYTDTGIPEVDNFEYVPLDEISDFTIESLRKCLDRTLDQFYPDMVDKRISKITI